MHAGFAVFLSIGLIASSASAELTKSGAYGRGIGLEAPAVGPLVASSRGTTGYGVSVALALQIELGTRFAIRFPFDVGATDSVATLGFAPGFLYRLRASDVVIPYAGLGLRFGALSARKYALGLSSTAVSVAPLSTQSGGPRFDFSGFGDSDLDGADRRTRGGVWPELWLGAEILLNKWFLLNVAGSYFYASVSDVGVHVMSLRIGSRFSL